MRLLRVVLICWCLAFSGSLSAGYSTEQQQVGAAAPGPAPQLVAGQLLLGFLPWFDDTARDQLIAALGGVTLAAYDRLDARLIQVAGRQPLGEMARAFAAFPGVRYAEPNSVVQVQAIPNDQFYPDQWALPKISAPTAWETTTGSREIVVGVVDSGIDYTHPDLAANIWSAPTGWTLGGCAAGSHGYRMIGGVSGCDPQDDLGVGTAVAGVIGAVGNNSLGISGVSQQVSLMALKCVDANGYLQLTDAIAVLDYAVAAKAAGVNLRVLSVGWTTETFSTPLRDAVAAAGAADILVVAAAGDASNDNDHNRQYPANFGASPDNLTNVIAVTATTIDDGFGRSVGYGRTTVHLAAPGENIRTTTRGGYGWLSSSNLAAAHVSGAAALLLATNLTTPPPLAVVRARLLACGDPLESLQLYTTTGRRLNVARLVGNAACDYTLTTIVEPSRGQIIVTPAAPTYASGTVVTLTATAQSGYRFVGWFLDTVAAGTAPTLSITMTSDHTVAAEFVAITSSPTPSSSPTPGSSSVPSKYPLTLLTSSGGRINATAANGESGPFVSAGTVMTLTAIPGNNAVFTGWTIDGTFQGWASPLTITMHAPHTVLATFATRPTFRDLPPGPPPYDAVSELAARRILLGYGDGNVGVNDTILRAQMAALIVRTMGWGEVTVPNPFIDQAEVDAGLWRAVATLAHYGIAKGYGDGRFGTRDPVLQVQTVAFISRAMVYAGYWEMQPATPQAVALLPGVAAHHEDLATYIHYAGLPPTVTTTWGSWSNPATRGWFAQTLWQALDSYHRVDRVP